MAVPKKVRSWQEVRNIAHQGGLALRIDREGSGYVAELELPLRDGRVLVCRGFCSFADALRAQGHDPKKLAAVAGYGSDIVGAVDSSESLSEWGVWAWDAKRELDGKAPSDPSSSGKRAWWEAQGAKGRTRWRGARNTFLRATKKARAEGKKPPELRAFLAKWQKLPPDTRYRIGYAALPHHGILDKIGSFVKHAAKSEAFKKVLSVAGSVIRNPVVITALGGVTGGAILPALAAANTALGLMEVAQKALPGSPAKLAAMNVIRVSQILHGRASGDRPVPKGVTALPRGRFAGGELMTVKQAEKLRGMLRTVKAARATLSPAGSSTAPVTRAALVHKRKQAIARTVAKANALERFKRDPERKKVAAVLPKPSASEVARYVVSIKRATAA